MDGHAVPANPGPIIEYRVPDMYQRPWAEIWERNFEQNMEKGEEEDIFTFN